MVCNHSMVELRVKTTSSGSPLYGYQCLKCGSTVGSWITKFTAEQESKQTGKPVAAWNENLRTEFYEQIANARKEEREQHNEEWWEQYAEYLRSPQWASKRERVLERDGRTCQACLVRDAREVHHLTYKHVFNEPLFELISVCKVCHAAITALDRQTV